MSHLIDRRSDKNKMHGSKHRFYRRYKKQIEEAVAQSSSITKRKDGGYNVSLPERSLSEPKIRRGAGGVRSHVLSGNRKYSTGDELPKPEQDEKGSKAGNSGEGEDSFDFVISEDEYAKLFFEGLALPPFIEKESTQLKQMKRKRAGFVPVGSSQNISIVRTMKTAVARRIAGTGKYKKRIKECLALLENTKDKKTIKVLEEEIEALKKKIKKVPYIDDVDVRYHNVVEVEFPKTQAVVFFVMDVSGSMDEARKNTAKRFFMLYHAFLKRQYENIEVVFIRHHTDATIVDEHEFFYSRMTGGTVISTALEKVVEQMETNYQPHSWNIYVAQASDGDNYQDDISWCSTLLQQRILPFVRYYTYVEVLASYRQEYWELLEGIGSENLKAEVIREEKDVYPVFRRFFSEEN